MTTPDQNKFGEMLRYTRPAGSQAEAAFNAKYLDSIEGMQNDKLGNRWLVVGSEPIIWSSHTDTVHRKSGMQNVRIRSSFKNQAVAYSDGSCLGADCTTGVFIMLHMIENKVPGLYVFHASEERGCIGSKALVAANKETFSKNFKAVIAFDRKGTQDVITHQLSGRTCSDAFANSLAKQLGNGYCKDDTGVYTDSAYYANCVSECTNISVGYYGQHTKNEWQDVEHVLWLADRMTKVDLDALVFERDPTKEDEDDYYYGGMYRHGYYGYGRNNRAKPNMLSLCRDYPFTMSEFLKDEAYMLEDIKEWCLKNAKHVHDSLDW